MNRYLKSIGRTVFILIMAFGCSLLLQEQFQIQSMIPMVFALAVFCVSLFTEGYIYGIVASLVSMMAVNFAFTFPYFEFNFTIPENLVSAVAMLAITIATSTLTVKVRQQDKIKAEIEKEKMRANLLRAVSHDLRTPLTTIYGSSSAILENYKDLTEEQHICLARGIQEDADWLMRMVENLLSVTRISEGNVKIIKTPIVLEELIDSVLVKFKKRYPGYEVHTELPEEFVSIPMDAVLIGQVLLNILENAVQHAQGMTYLGLKVFVRNEKAVFEVLDNGAGIPKDRLEDIFSGYHEPKEDVPMDHKKRSMGIGLSVCAAIIKAHDGAISAENVPEGGAVFRFVLDREVEEDE